MASKLPEKLNELADLLVQLRLRRLHPQMREFMKDQELHVGQGWTRIQEKIEGLATLPDINAFVASLGKFIQEAVLASSKHVFVLSSDLTSYSDLAPPMPRGARRDYLAASFPSHPAEQLGWFLEQRSIGSATVHTYVSNRPVRQVVEVEETSLNKQGRAQYRNAELIAKFNVQVRCYDHIVRLGKKTLLLLDAPPGVDRTVLAQDETKYSIAIRARMDESVLSVFTDLFPAVAKLWHARDEGIVNWLGFVSNRRAEITGRYSRTSLENYRDHEFQRAGERGGAQVKPFKIAVKWTDRPNHPVVALFGKADMAKAGTAASQGGGRSRLNHFVTSGYMSWDDFVFVTDRVLAQLPKART